MAEGESFIPNPFTDRPKRDPMRLDGPLSVRDMLALTRAPRVKPPAGGTYVTVRSKPVRVVPGKSEHMWVEFNDGRDHYIARGGPEAPAFGSALLNDLSVMGQVNPAPLSPDHNQGQRVLGRRFLPGVSAEEATADARRHAAGVNNGRGDRYGWAHNSNSFAADVAEGPFGRRLGDERTPGYRSRLKEGPPWRPIEERARELVHILTLSP